MPDFRPNRSDDPDARAPAAAGQSHRLGHRPTARATAPNDPARTQHHAPVGRLLLVLPALPRPGNDKAFVDPTSRSTGWPPAPQAWKEPAQRAGGIDLYVGGAEHAVLHLLYARFWHKVLFDLGYVSTQEPFASFSTRDASWPRLHGQRGIYVPADKVVEPRGRHAHNTLARN